MNGGNHSLAGFKRLGPSGKEGAMQKSQGNGVWRAFQRWLGPHSELQLSLSCCWESARLCRHPGNMGIIHI